MNLKGRSFLKLLDYTPEEISYLIDLAIELKAKKKQGVLHNELVGKNIALIFETSIVHPCFCINYLSANFQKTLII